MWGPIMGEEEVKVGMLTKRAQKKKSIGPVNYKERVFVLTNTKLSYYEGTIQQRGKIKESFGIETISFVGPIHDTALNRTSAFQIIHNDCYLYCCAKGAADRDEWIQAIQRACRTHSKSLQSMFHPSIYNGGKWQCCGRTDRNNKGCEAVNLNNGRRYSKPLPEVPRDLGVPGPSPHLGSTYEHNKFQHLGGMDSPHISVPTSGFPKLPPKPSSMLNKNLTSHGLEDDHEHLPNPLSGRLPELSVSPRENNTISHSMKFNSLSNRGAGHALLPIKSNRIGKRHNSVSGNEIITNPRFSIPSGSSTINYNENQDSSTFAYSKYNASKGGIHTPSKSYEFTTPQAATLPRPKSPEKTIAIALYDFEPVEPEDIELRSGERYTVLETSRPHWWKVRDFYGREGYVPANYLKDEKGDGLEGMSWFQKDISRQRAEYLLKQDGKEGSFIVRNSSQQSVVYTLSVISKCGSVNGPIIVKHYHIKRNDQGKFYLSEKHSMSSIVDLINYHKHNAGGLVTRLRQAPSTLVGSGQPDTHLFSNSQWEIDMNEIELLQELGSGQFGVVRLGLMRRKIYVAIKIMKDGSMGEDDFIEEAEVMTRLRHKNLVELYGVVTKQRPICIVTEYMENGCLLDYIRKNSHLQTHPGTLLDMCYQVCDAMKYLEEHNMIHRDLAARNCLVGKNMLIKVADFGLTRYVLDDEYTSSLGSKFPIKWAAPEVLNYTKFSSKSDVWAFGVLTWELFTGGKMPYRALGNSEVVERVANGYRLERPPNCPHDVYQLMLQTWDMDPDKRPSFRNMFGTFDDLIDKVTANCTPEGMYDA